MDMSMFLLKNSQVQNIFSQLGSVVDNEYVPFDGCYAILLHMYEKLITEDAHSRDFRQIIGFSNLLKKDLIPMLITVNDEKILEILIKILGNIMTPVECMGPTSMFIRHENSLETIPKLNWILSKSKIEWANSKAIKRITQIIRENIIKLSSSEGCPINCQTSISDCLRLIKNILHVPDDQYQNYILWKLFTEHFDEILIDLILNSNRKQWLALIIELIALIFKNQHVDQMSNTMSKINETINSDGSEDDESNTSPNNETHSSQEISSESSSSQSDDDEVEQLFKGNRNKKKKCVTDSMNGQDKKCLNVLKQNSNIKCADAELHNKPMFKETNISAMYNLERLNLQDSPMPKKICIISFLQKFTLRFLRNGFNTIIDEVYNILASKPLQYRDTSLYFWILTYFCRFCKLNKIELQSVSQIVSFKLISYIAHEGFKVSEQLSIAKRQKPYEIHIIARNLHLVIMAIKEVIQLIEFYRQTSLKTPVYMELITYLKCKNSPKGISLAKDLKSLFALVIRQYDSKTQTIDYLNDIIVTTHMVLSLFDKLKDCWNSHDCITAHLKKFAVPDIMAYYGLVLQNYKTNDELINEAVFTMMHHIIGEFENTTVLFQPNILKVFLNIFEENGCLYERWSDLIECVINRFLILPQK